LEIVTENHGVGGSIPPLGTNDFNEFDLIFSDEIAARHSSTGSMGEPSLPPIRMAA